jgi:hypothetical protein
MAVKLACYLCMSATPDRSSPSSSQPQFSGFVQPQQNWFKMPYDWTDITAKITSLAELKVVEYVLKHTWGYHEYGLKKKISIDEFMHGRKRKDGTTIDRGTGLSKQSVIDGLKNAVNHGFLEVEKDDSDQARKKRYYALKMLQAEDEAPPEEPESSQVDTAGSRGGQIFSDEQMEVNRSAAKRGEVKHLDADVKNLDIRGQGSRHRSEKDTSDRYLNNNNVSQLATDQAVVDALIAEGIATEAAHQLAKLEHVTLDFVLKQIDQRDFLAEVSPERVKRPTAFLVRAIQRAYPEPDGYKPKAVREAEAAARRHQEEERRRSQVQVEQLVQAEQVAKHQALDQKRQTEAERLAHLQAEWGSTDREHGLWHQVLTDLEVQLKSTIGYSLLEHCVLLRVQDGEVVIAAPNNWAKSYIAQRLSVPICQALEQHLEGQKVTLQCITPDLAPAASLAGGVATDVTADSHPDRQLPFG